MVTNNVAFKVGDEVCDRAYPYWTFYVHAVSEETITLGISKLSPDISYATFGKEFVENNYILKEIYNSPLYQVMKEE